MAIEPPQFRVQPRTGLIHRLLSDTGQQRDPFDISQIGGLLRMLNMDEDEEDPLALGPTPSPRSSTINPLSGASEVPNPGGVDLQSLLS